MESTARNRHYTLDEYFALEAVGDARYEYWDGDIFCMSGGSPRHGQLTANIHGILFGIARRRGCRAFTSDQAIYTPARRPYRYPDASVVCGEPAYRAFRAAALVNPILTVEVLSPESETRDRHEKRIAYQGLPSLREYVLLSQDAMQATLYARAFDSDWTPQIIEGQDGVLRLPSLDCHISLSDIYENVRFPGPPLREA
jgi:Uma2 family endonuclease